MQGFNDIVKVRYTVFNGYHFIGKMFVFFGYADTFMTHQNAAYALDGNEKLDLFDREKELKELLARYDSCKGLKEKAG